MKKNDPTSPDYRKPKKSRFIVTKDGVDCGLGLRNTLGSKLRSPGGVLLRVGVPHGAGSAHDFASKNSAERAIKKAVRARRVLSGEIKLIGKEEFVLDSATGTMVDQMPQLSELLKRGTFAIRIA